MKKVILLVAVVLAALTSTQVFAQYKPAAGENTLELQLSPFNANPLSMAGIRYRRFLKENLALRATVYLGITSTTAITQQANASANLLELKSKGNSVEFGFKPGIEKHFKGTNRLSPYVGAELDFSTKTTKNKSEYQVGTNQVETHTETNGNYGTKIATGYTRFGMNAIFGADYYVAEKVFLGAELGFGFAVKKDKAIREADSAAGYVAGDDIKGGSSVTLAPTVLAQFRLGVVF